MTSGSGVNVTAMAPSGVGADGRAKVASEVFLPAQTRLRRCPAPPGPTS